MRFAPEESGSLRPVLYIGGTFDLFHPGHVRLLARAREIGEVTVALNTDSFVEEYKGRKPIMTLDERLEVVAGCRYVDDVIINVGGRDSRESILKVNPDFIVHGDDWMGNEFLQQLGIDRDFLVEHSIGLIYLTYTPGVSTSTLIRRAKCDWQSSALSTSDTRQPSLSFVASTSSPPVVLTRLGSSAKTTRTPEPSMMPAASSESAGPTGWSLR